MEQQRWWQDKSTMASVTLACAIGLVVFGSLFPAASPVIGAVILLLQAYLSKMDSNYRNDKLNVRMDEQDKKIPETVIHELKNGAGDHLAAKVAEKVNDAVIVTTANEIAAERTSAQIRKAREEGIEIGRRLEREGK